MRKIFFVLTITCVIMLTGCSNVAENDVNAITEQQNMEDVAAENVQTVISNVADMQTENLSTDNAEEVVKIISAQASWAINVSEPSVICENADYLLMIRVKTKEKTKYFVKNSPMPARTYNVEVLDVLMNDDGSVPKNIKLVVNGGIVSMQEFLDTKDEETKLKLNADKLTKKELEEMILIHDDSYYELVQDQEYYIFVRDLTSDDIFKGYYSMPDGGYDVFQEQDGEYVNVLTNAKLDIESLESER